MWSVNAVHVAHGNSDVDAVVAVVIAVAVAVAARSGLGSHARDTLAFLYLSCKYSNNGG